MSPKKLSTVALALAACVATSVSVFAEDTPARVRGTLQKMDGNTLTIATKSGKEANVPLKDGAPIIAVTKGAMSDIKDNTAPNGLPEHQANLDPVSGPERSRGTRHGRERYCSALLSRAEAWLLDAPQTAPGELLVRLREPVGPPFRIPLDWTNPNSVSGFRATLNGVSVTTVPA